MSVKNPRQLILILSILILAGIFRFYNLSGADVITDEALIGFRSIGYIDFFVSPYQTTPYEWFSQVPAWAKLSFHDHPPLVFVTQHFFFWLFGVSTFILRLPFALAGVASVFLVYLIGKTLFSNKIGLTSALLLAVSSSHVWISRIGLQESILIFFSLLTFYYFIKALDDSRHWRWGIAFGLAMLTKYTVFVLLPILIVYFLFLKKEELFSKKFWLGAFISIIIFSPVIFYNINLYKTTGHFDLQFSYLLNQDVPEWQFLPGKIQAGSLTDRLVNLVPNFYQVLMWPTFVIFVPAVLFGLYKLSKDKYNYSGVLLILITILFYLLSLLLTGPALRFLVPVISFVVILVSWFIVSQFKIWWHVLIVFVVAFEIFITVNTLFVQNLVGSQGVTYSKVKWDSYNWGYAELNFYIENLLNNKRPSFSFTPRYQFLIDLKDNNQAEEEVAYLLIYDQNMYDLATLWLFHRPFIYQGWPIVTAEDYSSQSQEFWTDQGITDFYFFSILDNDILQRSSLEKTSGASKLLATIDVNPEIIKRPDGREVFEVYHWQ